MTHHDLFLPRQLAAEVLGVTARAWGLAPAGQQPTQQRRHAAAAQMRALARAAACLGRAGASPSRLRHSALGFDISY